MQQKLDRTLGLFSSLTISIGTMVGSAIFVLAGISFETAGPSASLAVFLSGIAALFTALSFAELVTFIPTAGGGYAYVRDATNNGILGFICGWGFWLGYAISCSLFALGFGTFLNYFFPFIPQMLGAYLLIFYVLFTNIKGIKNSGKLQDIITVGLIGLLIGYIIYGFFFMDINHQTPYFTNGLSGTFKAMGFLYMTYIGYGLITTASEEVIEPEKTIPKAIMISIFVVILIKTTTFFVGSSILHWSQLTPQNTSTPMIDTALKMSGKIGGYLFAFAGILATLSSINTAVMASSRTAYALARDQRFPAFFKSINSTTKTPIFSIIITGLIVFVATTIRDLEHLSTVTSIFSLTGYSLVNVALILFRQKLPHVERKFKVPLYPLSPIVGILINLFMVFQLMISDLLALMIASIIILIGIFYYYVGLPRLKEAPKGITPQVIPTIRSRREIEYRDEFNILIPIENPHTVKPLIQMGLSIEKKEIGKIIPIHVMNIPEVIPLDSKFDEFRENMKGYEETLSEIKEYMEDIEHRSEPQLVLSRDIPHAITAAAIDTKAKLVLLGWHQSGFAHRMLGNVVHQLLEKVPTTVGVFKAGKSFGIKKILLPYGGGLHSQGAVQIAKKIAKTAQCEITLFRVVPEEISEEEYNEIQNVLVKGLDELQVSGNIKILKDHSIAQAIINESNNHDLLLLGVTMYWGDTQHITGRRTDYIMENVTCNALIIRAYNPTFQKKNMRRLFNKLRKISK